MLKRHGLRRSGGIALTVLLGACSSSAPYFPEPDRVGVGAPIEEGATLYIGVAWLDAHPGDRVELVDMEAVGLDREFWSPMALRVGDIPAPEGEVSSVGTETDDPGRGLDELLRPLAAFTFTDADGTAQAVIEVAPVDAPMTLEFSEVRLSFRVNGGPVHEQVFPFQGRICVETPRTGDCPALDQ